MNFRQSMAALLGVICFVGLSAGIGNSSEAKSAAAGWADVEITPPLGIMLGGRGGPETAATNILDPLFAQVLYLKDAKGTGMVVVSLDTVGIAHELSDRLRTLIVRELGVDFNLVVINCSHTHSGPYMFRDLMAGVGPMPDIERDYFSSLTDKIVTATRQAAKSLTPVTVEEFVGRSMVAVNRRGKNAQGKRSIVPDPDGPIAEKVWILRLTPTNGDAPAIVYSYACHPVIVYGLNFSAVSADFPGVVRNTLKEKLGGEAHIQFIQGTAGDVRPRVVADFENKKFRPSKPGDLESAGAQLADDVMNGLNKTVLKLDIAGTMDRPFLPRDKPPAREVYEKMAGDKSAYRQAAAKYWLARYDSGEGFARGDACSVGLIRLAKNQWIVYMGGEPCVEWGPLVAKWLKPRNVVMWGYSQESLSYIPTEELLPQGGYEVNESNYLRASTPAPFAPGLEDSVHRSLQQQAAFIAAGKK